MNRPIPYAQREGPALVGLAAILGAGVCFILGAGPAPQVFYTADVAVYLDACHRVSLGQSLDGNFTFPIGPAGLLPTVVAMRLFGANVTALAIGGAMAWGAFGAMAWLAARPRIPAALAAAFAVFVAATAAAPYTLDFGGWRLLSYGMVYNRLAWAALCIAAVTLLPRRDGRVSPLATAGLGACTIWLWALKPNYLAALLPLVACDFFQRHARTRWLLEAAGGGLALLALVWMCVPFSPAGYVRNHFAMAQAAHEGALSVYSPARTVGENVGLVLCLAAVWALVLKTAVPAERRRPLGIALAALAAGTLAANLTNNQFSEIPIWGALGWLAAGCVAGAPAPGGLATTALVLGLACGIGFTWQPLAGIGYNFAWKHYRAPGDPPVLAVASPAWKGMPLRPVPGESTGPHGAFESPGNYAAWLNDGLALLARVPASPGPILCLDWNNPFPFATRTTPATGDEVAWHVGRYIGPANHPDADGLLAQATAVMEPRRSLQPDSLAFKQRLFRPGLTASFVVAAESAHWRVWLRRPPPTGGEPAVRKP